MINNRKEIEDIEDFEKYVEEQLDIDEEDEMNCILPYDPFVSELDKESWFVIYLLLDSRLFSKGKL